MKVLIIEDNSQMRQMIRRIIRDISDEIREEEDGIFALEAYAKFQPDWVLMDIEMKEVNGIEASEQILAKYSNAKIIIITAHNEIDLRERAKKVGIKGFILKENLMVLEEILV